MRAIKHPSEAALALHAGGDLGPIARWRCARHLRRCQACQDEVAAFRDVRRMVAEPPALPESDWDTLAAEMRANIRLGLAAGECVREPEPLRQGMPRFTGFRTALALASLMLVLAAGIVMRRPAPPVAPAGDGVARVQSAAEPGRDARIQEVSYSANAEGSTGDSFVDPVTGDVTIRRVW